MECLRLSVRGIRGSRLPARISGSRLRVLCSPHKRRAYSEALPEALPKSEKKQEQEQEHQGHVKTTRTYELHTPPTIEFITIKNQGPFHPAYLRDSCTCPKCVDPSSKQKNFQTSDIPENITAHSIMTLENGSVKIIWKHDIPGFGQDHVSIFPESFFKTHKTQTSMSQDRNNYSKPRLWNKTLISKELQYVDFNDYMASDDSLFRILKLLHVHGLVLIRNVPESEKSVEDIAGRIGNIRDTFYGRTWDVKSIPEAKNVAYTHQYLGLHMDLLYMANPPGFQLLHCLKNSCKGGNSMFSDAFNAASALSDEAWKTLSEKELAYHYRNADEHYYFRHPVLESGHRRITTVPRGTHRMISHVNYSPPFQAPHISTGQMQETVFPDLLKALRSFAMRVESEDNLFEYRLQKGECVLFNNRRVLHGRRAFEAAEGERWLKGTYVDTDVFMSRLRVLSERPGALRNFDKGSKFVIKPVSRKEYKSMSQEIRDNLRCIRVSKEQET